MPIIVFDCPQKFLGDQTLSFSDTKLPPFFTMFEVAASHFFLQLGYCLSIGIVVLHTLFGTSLNGMDHLLTEIQVSEVCGSNFVSQSQI